MAFDHIGGAEPSTVTFKVATISMTRNSSAMHQELLTLADANSSLGVLPVIAAKPDSTHFGAVVRIASGPSSAADFPVRAVLSSTSADNPVTISGNSTVVVSAFAAGLISSAAPAGNSSALLVRIVGGASSAVDNVVRPVFSSTNTDNPVRAVLSSTAADNPVQISGNSSVVVTAMPANSSLVQLNAIAAGYLSSAAPAGNSSALLVRIVGGPSSAADLIANVSSVSGRVATMPLSTVWASSAGFHFDGSGNLNVAGSFSAAFSSTKADNLVTVYQSTASDLLVRPVFSSTGADNPVSVSALPANSSLHALNAIAAGYLSSAAPAGNSSAFLVRIVGGPSSAADLISNVSSVSGRVGTMPFSTSWASSAGFHFDGSGNLNIAGSFSAAFSSTLADNLVTVYQSTATDLLMRPVFSSTSADNPVRAVLSSTAADNPVVATIGTNLQSSVAPSSGSSGLMVRPIIDTILTSASSNAFATTSFTIQSSGAGIRNYVTAYSILTTNASAAKVAFYSGSSMNWPVVLQAVSSGVSGVNLAVSAPAYIFRTNASEAFTLQTPSSLAGFKVAVSYFRAP